MLIRLNSSTLTGTLATLAVSGGLVFATAVPSQAAEVSLTQQSGESQFVRQEMQRQQVVSASTGVDAAGTDVVSLTASVPTPEPAAPAVTPAATTVLTPGAGAAAAAATAGATATAAAPARPQVVVGSSIIATASQFIGYPYVSGGNRPETGFDCSGLVQYVYGLHGISLPRTDAAQKAAGTVISEAEAQPGDLVWWPGHIGFYAGNHQVLDAGNPRVGVSQRAIWGSPTFIRI
ncbi:MULTISPECIES: C40 family peptidase [unclassified Pseudoclavibacter]|uniref:C40 family peptidase n=1 Tax=unclassified Pseudoclavibacter TaxID=2615177 RepID=UPI0013015BA4|nr:MULTISPECIES: NlpC/P60 family protein [unclassified Pseudoclavibacter]KAB1647292.1 glycoside hydrolase [Pseudoclavibacter sp. CFCC 14310]KAB1662715.1 glycoside hydrolase [Pseudoclavibacter sp. CFCC 13611]